MKARRRSKPVIITVIVLSVACAYFIYLGHQRREYRAKLALFTAELTKSHADADAVRALLSQPRFKGLKLREDSGTLWEIGTPLEFGARNWKLLIEVRGSKVAALRVRTEDSMERRPKGAPPDKFF
jgi:hypothetical protein